MTEPVSVLIADDDPTQLAYLSALVRRLRPEWRILVEATSSGEVEQELALQRVSVAILDIRLSDTTSLEIVKNLRENFPVIFVTGDPAFAVDAFSANAVDFVLKPVKPDRFEQALRKADEFLASQTVPEKPLKKEINSLRMFKGRDLVWAQLSEVRYFEAQRKYTRVVLKDQEGLLKMGISSVVKFLNADRFWRIHRGMILNVAHMESARRDEFGRLIVRIVARNDKLVVAKPYERLFRDGFS